MITDTLTINVHVHAHGCVHVFDFCHDWTMATMATKACKFASVGRSLNLERLSGMHQR